MSFPAALKLFWNGLLQGNVIPDPAGRDIIYRFGRTKKYPRGAVFGRDLRPLMALEAQVAKYPNASFSRNYRRSHG